MLAHVKSLQVSYSLVSSRPKQATWPTQSQSVRKDIPSIVRLKLVIWPSPTSGVQESTYTPTMEVTGRKWLFNKPKSHRKTDWFQIGKGVCQGCILSSCLFNLYPEHIIRKAGLEEAQLESRLLGEISITSDMQMTPSLWQKVKN